jgi:signal transduction histidine kinase
MREPRSLRHRIVAAYVLMTCAVCGVFAAAALHAIESVEDRLIDQRLARTADRLVQRHRQGLGMDLPPSVGLYEGNAIPVSWRGLTSGRHERVLGSGTVNLLVRNDDGRVFVLADDDADFEAIRWQLHAVLAAAFLACLALAWLLGRSTASRVLAPVTDLADAVQQERQPDAYPSLQSRDEIGVLSRAFAARTRALQQVLARERWFVADVSHELRTPLTVMLGAAEVLCAQTTGHTAWQAHAERIRRTAADTSERVSALLLLSRAPDAVNAPRVSIASLVQLEIERCQDLLRDKDVVLSFEQAQAVHLPVSAELAATAIGNLVRNACQYTERGSIAVRLEGDRLTVQDTGTGLPLAVREKIFGRLVPADGTSPTGSGLGLAIVARVADHLGWTVTLEASTPAGSRFVLAWPGSA